MGEEGFTFHDLERRVLRENFPFYVIRFHFQGFLFLHL